MRIDTNANNVNVVRCLKYLCKCSDGCLLFTEHSSYVVWLVLDGFIHVVGVPCTSWYRL